MALFKAKHKESRRKSSINKFKSPYLSKTIIPNRKKKRVKKKRLSILPPARLKSQNESKLKKIFLLIIAIGLIILSCYLLFFSNIFQIKKFEVIDDGTIITDNLELNKLLEENILKKNLFFINEDNLREKIINNFPEIADLQFKKNLPSKITVELKKYPTVANLIDIIKSPDGIQIQKKYLINSNGIVITENEENSDLPYLKVTTEEILGLKTQALEKDKLDYIIKVINLFEEKFGMNILEAEYLTKEREIHLKTEKLFYVFIDITKDMIAQIEKLKKALPKLDIYKTPLEYIDLRISGTDTEKIIFKRRKS